MSKSRHTPEAPFTQNQNNAMSDDPGDGNRLAFKPGKDGSTPVEKAPEQAKTRKPSRRSAIAAREVEQCPK